MKNIIILAADAVVQIASAERLVEDEHAHRKVELSDHHSGTVSVYQTSACSPIRLVTSVKSMIVLKLGRVI